MCRNFCLWTNSVLVCRFCISNFDTMPPHTKEFANSQLSTGRPVAASAIDIVPAVSRFVLVSMSVIPTNFCAFIFTGVFSFHSMSSSPMFLNNAWRLHVLVVLSSTALSASVFPGTPIWSQVYQDWCMLLFMELKICMSQNGLIWLIPICVGLLHIDLKNAYKSIMTSTSIVLVEGPYSPGNN